MDGLSAVASIIAVLQISEKVIQHINSAAGAKHERGRLRDQVRTCSYVLLQLKDNFEDSEEAQAWSATISALSRPDAPLTRLHEALSLVAVRLQTKHTIAKALQWPFQEKEVGKLMDMIEREKSLLILALANNSGRLLEEIKARCKENTEQLDELKHALSDGLQTIQIDLQGVKLELGQIQDGQTDLKTGIDSLQEHERRQQASKERCDMLNWLSVVNHTSQQRAVARGIQAGTGQELINSSFYQEWLETPGQTLFCPGDPGAGKTVQTSIIIEDLYKRRARNTNIAFAFIYCDYGRQDEQVVETLMASLLRQLFECQATTSKSMAQMYRRVRNGERPPSLLSITQALESEVTSFQNVYIVIDALDECQDADACRTRLISMLLDLQQSCKLNIFATSRFIPTITEKFEGSPSVPISASSDDVRIYLEAQMHRLRLAARNSALQELVKARIVEAVDGIFLLARLHFDSLVKKTAVKAIRTALENLATGSDAYDRAYESAIERIYAQDPDTKELAIQILGWILCATTPLSVSALQAALGVELDSRELDRENCPDVETMLSACAGLVIIRDDAQRAYDLSGLGIGKESRNRSESALRMRFVHYTAQEYLQRTQKRWLPNAHNTITTTCATYLSFDKFGQSRQELGNKWGYKYGKSDDLYHYAAISWGLHARLATNGHLQVMNFLNRPINVDASADELLEFSRKMGGPIAYYDDAKFKYEFVSQTESEAGNFKRVPVAALHLAALFGLETVISELLQLSMEPDGRTTGEKTALMLAAKYCHDSGVRLLLNNGATVNLVCKNHRTALWYAVESGSASTVSLLLAHYKSNGIEMTCNTLLDNYQLSECKHCLKNSPLHAAASHGYASIAKFLISSGVSVSPRNDYSWTPMHIATIENHPEVIRVLLEAHAEVDAKDQSNATPLHIALYSGHTEVAEILIKAHADVNAMNGSGLTPLSIALEDGLDAMTKLLLEYGAQPNSKLGHTPMLFIACESGKEQLVQLLLDAGADINAQNERKETSLLRTVICGHLPIVTKLLQHGADPNTKDQNNVSPLHEAITHNQADIALLLISHGADEDEPGQSLRPLFPTVADRMDYVMPATPLKRGPYQKFKDCAGNTVSPNPTLGEESDQDAYDDIYSPSTYSDDLVAADSDDLETADSDDQEGIDASISERNELDLSGEALPRRKGLLTGREKRREKRREIRSAAFRCGESPVGLGCSFPVT